VTFSWAMMAPDNQLRHHDAEVDYRVPSSPMRRSQHPTRAPLANQKKSKHFYNNYDL